MLDAAAANGLRFAELAPTTGERLAAVLGVGTIIGNPLDSGFTGLTNREAYVKCVEAMLDDPGIDLVLELTGFAEELREARMVITGEGTLDGQTLNGKAPAGVAAAARKASVPVIAVAGHSTLSQRELRSLGILAAYALTDIEPDRQRCMSHAGPLLERLGARLASQWLSPRPA